MSRGRPRLEENIEKPKVYKHVFKGEDCDTTWFYDESVTKNGPVRVDIKWHKTYKQLQQEGKQERAKEREKKNINKFFKDKETQPKTRRRKKSRK